MAENPKINPPNAPAAMPPANPNHGFCVAAAVAAPVKAEIRSKPSSATFASPERSEIKPPYAANKSGTLTRNALAKNGTKNCDSASIILHSRDCRDPHSRVVQSIRAMGVRSQVVQLLQSR